MFKKERFSTLITTIAFNHHRFSLGGFLFFWFLFPCFFSCWAKKAFKKHSKRIQKVLDIQNRTFRRKGYYWTLSEKMNELTLRRVPTFQHHAGYQNVVNPFMSQGVMAQPVITAPLVPNGADDAYRMVA